MCLEYEEFYEASVSSVRALDGHPFIDHSSNKSRG